MDKNVAAPANWWLEIDLSQAGAEISATARGCRGEQPRPHPLGPGLTVETLRQFGEQVRKAAARGVSLRQAFADEQALREARTLHGALFQRELQEVLTTLRGAAGDAPLLLRLMPHDSMLQGIPWEALCRSDTQLDFLGTAQKLWLARGVHSTLPWQPREVRGAVRLLCISPSDEEAPNRLRAVLHSSITAGELEWLPPLTGARAQGVAVLDRLRQEPAPHILHFIGHGGLDEAGAPLLRLADKEGQESWLRVELLAQELEGVFRGNLRLVVLEACEGGRADVLASAAEQLTRGGADAVVAHLWPVKTDVARCCSVAFYRSLLGASPHPGDVARSLHDARRSVLVDFNESAEAFSPVLYLRGRDSTLFDLRRRKLVPPGAPSTREALAEQDPRAQPLLHLLQQPFSLLLGDHLHADAWAATVESFRKSLHQTLQATPWAAGELLPLSALAQRYALQFGAPRLESAFRSVFRDALPALPLVKALAQRLRPGFHVTLLRLPVLEHALAELRPGLPLYVIRPSQEDKDAPLVQQHVAGQGWVTLDRFPDSFDPEKEVALLRLYRGFLPNDDFDKPLLTEDDYLLGVRDLEDVLPDKLASHLQSVLNRRPALLLGLSLLSWDHRHVLQNLFRRRPLPLGSAVLLEPGDAEGESWRKGRSLPGGPSRQDLQVIQVPAEGLAQLLLAGAAGVTP